MIEKNIFLWYNINVNVFYLLFVKHGFHSGIKINTDFCSESPYEGVKPVHMNRLFFISEHLEIRSYN
jgi:hypothetical protein